MKKFLQSAWFKCTVVLLAVILVSGGLLAILSDLLYLSPQERTARAIAKLYNGEKKEYQTVIDVDGDASDDTISTTAIEYLGQGKITKHFIVGDVSTEHDVLIQSVGYNGYKGGTVTIWIKVKVNGGLKSVDTVLLESFEKQTLMSKFDGSYYAKFQEITDIVDSYQREEFYVATGASGSTEQGKLTNAVSGAAKTSTAICNAVNCVIKYVGGAV